MHQALESAKMLGWELDLIANRWTCTADVPSFYGVPRGPDYSDPVQGLAVIHPEDVPLVLAKRQEAFESCELVRYEFRGSAPLPDGSPRWFTTRGRALCDASGKPVRLVAITTGVTERKRDELARTSLDRQLLDAQKWESLGVLAGGIAHDFNNILTIILGNAGLARRRLTPPNTVTPLLEQIEQASRRAADLCQQLLAYTGRGHIQAGYADLNTLIQSSAALLGVQVSEAARIRFDLGEDLPAIRADPAQVRQVLLNLAMNAAEAVGDNAGEIRIATRTVDVTPETSTGYHLPPNPGQYVQLTISDTGPGIAPELLPRIFDPFVTTKFAGRGLGLSAVLGIMRLHCGAIRVTTAPGSTTVEVLWSLANEIRRPPPAPSLPTIPNPHITAKALIVDDEIYVREMAASVLQELGYDPILAGEGQTALDLFQKHQGDVRVVILDVMMPGMTGEQLLQALRGIQPDLPAVFTSGFTEKRTLATGPGTRTEFLQKPYHPEELSATVERLMKASA